MHEHLHIPPIYTHGPFLGRELVSICRGNEAFEQKLVENEANIWRNVPLAGGGQGKQANAEPPLNTPWFLHSLANIAG